MKAVILAGGLGTRLSEETNLRPKPMVEIGSMPILWHIMKLYSAHGIDDFIVCCGYKGEVIKRFFIDYTMHRSDIHVDVASGRVDVLDEKHEAWNVSLIDTGEASMTGGRIRRIRDYIGDERFCLTYGDGVSNVDIRASIAFHEQQQALVTMTAVQPPGRYGAITLSPGQSHIASFIEKPAGDGTWVNGGFFVCEPGAFDLIDGDHTSWEEEPLERAARSGRLAAYRHEGFWQSMDTLRDKMYLEQLWASEHPPWKLW